MIVFIPLICIMIGKTLSKWPNAGNDTIVYIANPIEANMPGHWVPLSIVKVILGGEKPTVQPKEVKIMGHTDAVTEETVTEITHTTKVLIVTEAGTEASTPILTTVTPAPSSEVSPVPSSEVTTVPSSEVTTVPSSQVPEITTESTVTLTNMTEETAAAITNATEDSTTNATTTVANIVVTNDTATIPETPTTATAAPTEPTTTTIATEPPKTADPNKPKRGKQSADGHENLNN